MVNNSKTQFCEMHAFLVGLPDLQRYILWTFGYWRRSAFDRLLQQNYLKSLTLIKCAGLGTWIARSVDGILVAGWTALVSAEEQLKRSALTGRYQITTGRCLMSKHSRYLLQTLLLAAVFLSVGGCLGAITIRKPADNVTITSPAITRVVITGRHYSNLRISADGGSTGHRDFTSQLIPMGPEIAQADLNLPPDTYKITASADVSCWYCSGGKMGSFHSTMFRVVALPAPCTRSNNTPVITVPPGAILAGQTPGRQSIALPLNKTDSLIINIDDASDLQQDQMRVELDINPGNNVKWRKAIEAWGACHSGSRVDLVEASMIEEFGTGIINPPAPKCEALTAANDMRSGCTIPQTMLINQSTTSELLFRKPTFAGVWGDTAVFDSSIWAAWGGRHVRFIWWTD